MDLKINTRSYCTLFDQNYLTRGLALYSSLRATSSPFQLFILALDDKTATILRALSLSNVVIIEMKSIETAELLEARGNRPIVEYYWTCTPALLSYCLKTYALPNCTYLDADTYFFDDPERILSGLADDQVLITPHNYFSKHDQSKTSGYFCVQFMYFGSQPSSLIVLENWYRDCLNSCELNPEKGICGDQKYLDSWPSRFSNVVVSQDIGLGVAPWNVERFEFDGKFVSDGKRRDRLLFYHFHALKLEADGVVPSGSRYRINQSFFRLYRVYVAKIVEFESKLIELGFLDRKYALHMNVGLFRRSWSILKGLARRVFQNYNYRWNVVDLIKHESLEETCPICLESNATLITSSLYDDRYGYPHYFYAFECQSCRHRFLKHPFSENGTAHLYEQYYQRKKEIVEETGDQKKPIVYDPARAYSRVPNGSKVVEIGCGKGENLVAMKAKQCDVVGYELDSSVASLSQVLGVTIRCKPFEVSDFGETKVDAVVFEQVLEHIVSPIDFLNDVKRILGRHGQIIFSMPRYSGLCGVLLKKYWLHWHCPFHLHFFSDKSIKILAEKLNMNVASIEAVAPSDWLYYQVLHILYFPKFGEKSRFWSGSVKESGLVLTFFRKTATLAYKLGFFKLVAYVMARLGISDNYIVALVAK